MAYYKLLKKDLQEEAKLRGLPFSGTKAEIIARLEEDDELQEAEEIVEEEIVEEEKEEKEEVKVEVDAMPSEIPNEAADPLAEAKEHYIGPGSVSGSFIFDNIPGQVTARDEEQALEKYYKVPRGIKGAGAHQR